MIDHQVDLRIWLTVPVRDTWRRYPGIQALRWASSLPGVAQTHRPPTPCHSHFPLQNWKGKHKVKAFPQTLSHPFPHQKSWASSLLNVDRPISHRLSLASLTFWPLSYRPPIRCRRATTSLGCLTTSTGRSTSRRTTWTSTTRVLGETFFF